MLLVNERFLSAFFSEIEVRCGTIEEYPHQIGFDENDQRLLRSRLIEA
jgi:hypothetical protein